ncbi:MAG: hypothetical protein JOY68_01625 [Candidatus Dormibacteraeota bacterium]|nr:hypothetical protein [Candidatus Dormibacteraeota bacterium]
MLRRLTSGFLLIVGGVGIAVGAFFHWATIAGHDVTAFSFGGGNLDAIVSFVIAGVLCLLGLVMASRLAFPITRLFALLASICALAWAGLVALLISGFASSVASVGVSTVPGAFHIAFLITAGAAVVAFFGGLAAAMMPGPIVSPREKSPTGSRSAAPVQAQPPRAASPAPR